MSIVIGGFAPNKSIEDGDWLMMQRSGINGILLMAANHLPVEVDKARYYLGRDVDVIVRLLDATWSGKIESALTYAQVNAGLVRFFYARGVRKFQLDNEPSLQRGADGRGSWALNGGAPAYQQFMWEAITYLRQMIADLPGVEIGLAQLTDHALDGAGNVLLGPNGAPVIVLPDWMEALGWKTAALADFICCPAYWQGWNAIGHGWFGRNYKRFHEWQPGKPLEITEAGTDRPDLDEPTRLQVMAHEYPAFIRQLGREAARYKVRGARFYGYGLTPDWTRFNIQTMVADAMRPVIAEVQRRAA